MSGWIPLAWLQLVREPVRLCVALAGVAFAVILVFMQLGFQAALFESAVRIHQHLVADLVLFSPQSIYILEPKAMPRRRIYQAAAVDGVASATPVYVGRALWKHPITGKGRQILVLGFDPSREVVDLPAVRAAADHLKGPDRVLFDRAARPEYGPVPALFDRRGNVEVEVNNRHTSVVGLFEIGTSFGIDGILITSDLNLLRLFAKRRPGLMSIGLIRVAPGADPGAVRAQLVKTLARDVLVLTSQEFIEHEQQYWNTTTPIGFVFAFGSIMGLVVGGVMNADRVSLFLIDAPRQELWSKVAQGDGSAPVEIRIPVSTRIAGRVATTGRRMNVPDAYAEPLFKQQVDVATGYRTRTVLCHPIVNRTGVPMTWRSSQDDENRVPSPARLFSVGEGKGEGGQAAGIFEREVVGVAQLLSKRTGGRFDAGDERRFKELADSIGVILESWVQMTRSVGVGAPAATA